VNMRTRKTNKGDTPDNRASGISADCRLSRECISNSCIVVNLEKTEEGTAILHKKWPV
jgi:hypothetical protein